MSADKLGSFLRYAAGIAEPAAVFATQPLCDSALDAARAWGHGVTADYATAIAHLASGRSVAIKVGAEFPSDLYDLLRQYSHRRGIVQVLPKVDGISPLLEVNTETTKILLVVPAEHEAKLSERYPEFLSLIGLIERLQ
jgi:hypothetical protein